MADNMEVLGVVKVFGGGRVVVPSRARRLLGLADGDYLVFYRCCGRVCVEKVEIRGSRGLV